jgi:hypothetical protein
MFHPYPKTLLKKEKVREAVTVNVADICLADPWSFQGMLSKGKG